MSLLRMDREEKAPVPFCVRPPLCLSLPGGETKVSEKVFAEEARELQGRLREQLSQFWTEFGLFARLMYKNKNQHRRCLYYQRLAQVRRDLEMLNKSELKMVVEKLAEFSVIEGAAVMSKPASRFQPAIKMNAGKSLSTLLGVARLLNQVDGPILAASAELAGLLGQTFFMPFALTMFSCLARFRALLMQMLYETISTFNLLSAIWHKTHKESMRVLDQHFPAQLECQWNGSKLCMTENRITSFWGQARSYNDLEQGASLYAVDDRTGVQFDIGNPNCNAGHAPDRQMTLKVSHARSMTEDLDGNGIATDMKKASMCVSDPMADHSDPELPVVNGRPVRKESTQDAVDKGVTGLAGSNPFTTAMPPSEVNEKLSTESPDIVEQTAKVAITSELHTRDDGASQEKVAYTSVTHNFASVPNVRQLFQGETKGSEIVVAGKASIESSPKLKIGERMASGNEPHLRDQSSLQNKVAYTSVFHKFSSISDVGRQFQTEFRRSDAGGEVNRDISAAAGSGGKADLRIMEHREPDSSSILEDEMAHTVHLRSGSQGEEHLRTFSSEQKGTGRVAEMHFVDNDCGFVALDGPESYDVSRDKGSYDDTATLEHLRVADPAAAAVTDDNCSSLERRETIQDNQILDIDAAAVNYNSRSSSETPVTTREPGGMEGQWSTGDKSVVTAYSTLHINSSAHKPASSSTVRELQLPHHSTSSSPMAEAEAEAEAAANDSRHEQSGLESGSSARDAATPSTTKEADVSCTALEVQCELSNLVMPVDHSDTIAGSPTLPVEIVGSSPPAVVKDIIGIPHAPVNELDILELDPNADVQAQANTSSWTILADEHIEIGDQVIRQAGSAEGSSHDKQASETSVPTGAEDEQVGVGIHLPKDHVVHDSVRKKGSKRRRPSKGKPGNPSKRWKDEGDAGNERNLDKIDGTSLASDKGKESKRKATNDIFAMLLGGLD